MITLPPLINPVYRIGRRDFDFSRSVAVMAIVNRTPDSFYDRGATFALDRAIEAARRAVADGADWVDVGGVPFAPGGEVTVAEEIDRVLPVVEEIRRGSDVVISVDTFRAEVAKAVIAGGADVVNDTSGLHDPEVADVVAEAGATLVVTHSLAAPRTELRRPAYGDVTREVVAFLRGRIDLAQRRGVRPEQIIADPGHDLNKNTYHSLELTRRLPEVCELGYPVLAALSNKDFIGETLGVQKEDRLAGTIAAVVTSVLLGARIVRVHNVPALVAAVRMTEAMIGWREPLTARHNIG